MRKHREQHGAALIELALTIPFLLLLGVVVIDFGRALYEYNTVTRAVRDAVRYLSTKTPNTLCADAKNIVVYGSKTAGSTPLAPGLNTSAVSCSWQTAGTLPLINTVTVTVTDYRFQSMWKGMFGTTLTDGGITFGVISATMRAQT